MRVLVAGAAGLIGERVCRILQRAGHTIVVVSRNPGGIPHRGVAWDAVREAVAEVDGVVNLAGESIAGRRWTPARKHEILASRVDSTRALVSAMADAPTRPRVLINASAVGWYGPRGREEVDEQALGGTGFLADVCGAWEDEAVAAEVLDVRTVRLRIGVVLAPDGGALASMLIPFRACLGGVLGSGRQWMSWVHLDDVAGLVTEALANEAYRGAVNATAPNAVTNAGFTAALGRAVHRPAILPVPAFALRLALGEMATLLLDGQRVVPSVANAHGYAWKHPELGSALRACLDA